MRIQLTRRYARSIDGIDLSRHGVGDVFDICTADGALLIAEGWARAVVLPVNTIHSAARINAAGTHARIAAMLSNIRRRIFPSHEHRRADDQIRDEWHDAHATTLERRAS
jgi:hypothetical protein